MDYVLVTAFSRVNISGSLDCQFVTGAGHTLAWEKVLRKKEEGLTFSVSFSSLF